MSHSIAGAFKDRDTAEQVVRTLGRLRDALESREAAAAA